MIRSFWSVAAVSAACLISTSASAQQCVKDMDCPGDAICEGGQCVGEDGQPVSAAPSSTTPSDVAPAPGAPAETGPRVKVQFILRGGDPVLVKDTVSGQSCMAPCTLMLPPGAREIRVGSQPAIGGQVGIPHTITVPTNGGRFSVREQTTGLIVGGAVLTGVGIGLLIPGLVFLLVGGSSEDDTTTSSSTDESDDTLGELGLIFTIAGTAMTLPGIVLLAASDGGSPQMAKGPQLTPVAAVTKDGGMLGLRLSF